MRNRPAERSQRAAFDAILGRALCPQLATTSLGSLGLGSVDCGRALRHSRVMEPAEKTSFTEDEYLALERASQTKHEFIDGEIISMAGGSPRHSLIATNVARALGNALRDRPCAVLGSDQSVNIASIGGYVYPDVTVICGKPELGRKNPAAVQNPVLLVEVLSKSTRHYDLGEKFDHSRKLPSLMDFVAIRKNERRVQHWHRTEVGRWELAEVEGEGTVELPGLGVTISLAELYEKVELFPEEED